MARDVTGQVDSRGNPIDPGLYRQTNRHGELQDVNNSGRVGFHDTFIGDLLGFDGQVGAQGAGMVDSIRGARRADPMRPQARPEDMPIEDPGMTVSPRPQTRPEPDSPSGPPPEQNPDEIPRDESGNPLPVIAAAAAAGAAGAEATRRIVRHGGRVHPRNKGSVALTPDDNGNVMIMRETNNGYQQESVPVQRAVDDGWSVVGVNYEDGSNALPAPDTTNGGSNAVDSISERSNQSSDTTNGSSNVIEGTATDITDEANRSVASAEDAPIDDPMSTNAPEAGSADDITSRIVRELPAGLEETPNPLLGGVAYRGNGQVFVEMPGGGYVDIAAMDKATRQALMSVMRAVRP